MPRCPTCHRRLSSGAQCPEDGDSAPLRAQVASKIDAPALPGYRVIGLIGEGGFSHVWQAGRVSEGSEVAIKLAHAATSLARRRFGREAAALSAIGAPHVPELHEHGVLPDGRPYLVMERLHDQTLAAILQQRAAPPEVSWVGKVGVVVLDSLQAVHDRQLIHRDLKPENIFLSQSRRMRARLTDFGIVRVDDPDAGYTSEHTIIGTAEYMPPEQIAGRRDVDVRADIYAFGVLLYELLTLRVPFTGDLATIEKGHASLRPPRPSEFASVPEALEALCLECLAKDPSRRPHNVAELRRRLIEACRDAGNMPIVTRPATPPPVKLLSVSRQPVVLLAATMPALDRSFADTIARRKGFIARQQGMLLICGFSGVLVEKPEQAAIGAAGDLVERYGARVVLHFAEITIRPGATGRPPKLYGKAADEPMGWLPTSHWSGVLITAAMAEILAEGRTRPSPTHPGFHEFVPAESTDASAETPLFGRDEVMKRARQNLEECLHGASPSLFTIIGEHGMGKSRLAREIASLVRREHPGVEIHRLRATRRSMGRASEIYRELLRVLASRGDSVPESLLELRGSVSSLGDELRFTAKSKPLALIIDDAHYADDTTLDALEYATLDGPGIRLWIVACAHPRLDRRRPQWGRRSHFCELVQLEPLDEGSAMRMAAELLKPAEFPPRAVLEKLAQWTAGNPQSLEQLVRTLKRRGLVRQRGNSDSWYVATAELEQLPASPVGQWLAARQLDTLPPEQAACVRVCAVLGQEFARDELAWVQRAAERDHTASTTIDTDVGIAALEEQGIIIRVKGDIWAFANASFQDAIYRLVARRDREHIHRSALAYWQSLAARRDSDRVWASIARHAGACGARDIAADASLELGDRARREHRYVEADLYYTSALPFIDEGDHQRRARALSGRGRVSYRMQRVQESSDDLRRAQEHSRALGDVELTAEYMLEEATALDWESRFAESAQRVEDARALVPDSPSPRIAARLLMVEGRSHFRAGRSNEAIALLTRAVALAETVGDDETRIIAFLLLGWLLALAGEFDRAQRHFDEVISLCESTGDRFHLCVAYNNRAALWSARNSLTNLYADLRRTIQLAREVGQPILERTATHNLAEYLYWSGQYEDALALARRAYDLRRFLPEPVAADALLLARILAACKRVDEARIMVDEARHLANSGEPSISDELVITMLDLVLTETEDGTSDAWGELLRENHERLPGEEYLETLFFRARAALEAGRWPILDEILRAAQDKLDEYPIWTAPFKRLAESASLTRSAE